MPFATYHGIPHLLISEEMWEITQKRFPREMNSWRSGNPSIAIIQTNAPKAAGGSLAAEIVDVSLMSVTRDQSTLGFGLHLCLDLARLAVRGLRHRCLRPAHRRLAREHIHDNRLRTRCLGASPL